MFVGLGLSDNRFSRTDVAIALDADASKGVRKLMSIVVIRKCDFVHCGIRYTHEMSIRD